MTDDPKNPADTHGKPGPPSPSQIVEAAMKAAATGESASQGQAQGPPQQIACGDEPPEITPVPSEILRRAREDMMINGTANQFPDREADRGQSSLFPVPNVPRNR